MESFKEEKHRIEIAKCNMTSRSYYVLGYLGCIPFPLTLDILAFRLNAMIRSAATFILRTVLLCSCKPNWCSCWLESLQTSDIDVNVAAECLRGMSNTNVSSGLWEVSDDCLHGSLLLVQVPWRIRIEIFQQLVQTASPTLFHLHKGSSKSFENKSCE